MRHAADGAGLRVGTVDHAVTYRRGDLNDFMTLIQLKLAPPDSLPMSTAQHFNAIEADLKSWAVAKPILAARRLGPDGTRGIRMGDIISLSDRLTSNDNELFMRDPLREKTIVVRAKHTLGNNQGRWNSILLAD